jgi:CheY-like chemotaxis protein
MVTLLEPRKLNEPGKSVSLPLTTNGSKPVVLIAEDHADTRSLLKLLLEMRGYSVIEAADGEDAVWAAEKNSPDLILMDITLPHLSGLDAARQIHRFEKLNRVPIVFMSGHAQKGYCDAAFSAGAADYLVKPINLNQLENIIDKHLGQLRTS